MFWASAQHSHVAILREDTHREVKIHCSFDAQLHTGSLSHATQSRAHSPPLNPWPWPCPCPRAYNDISMEFDKLQASSLVPNVEA